MRERLYGPDPDHALNLNRLNPSPTVPKIIGLAGYARSGKDTVGQIIHRLYGHTVLSFSDILREYNYAQDLFLPGGDRLNDLVDGVGWEEARNREPYIRTLQQNTGEEARQILGGDVWVRAWTNRVITQGGMWVNPSVRYPNEVLAILNLGGVVLRVRRPGVVAVNNHISDRALDGEPLPVVFNDGSLVDLEGEVQKVLGEFDA